MTPEKAMLFYGSCLGIVICFLIAFSFWYKHGKIVTDIRTLFKFHSTKVIIALGALPSIWFELPPDWKAVIPSAWMRTLVVVVAIVGVLARAKVQENISSPKQTPSDSDVKNPPEL